MLSRLHRSNYNIYIFTKLPTSIFVFRHPLFSVPLNNPLSKYSTIDYKKSELLSKGEQVSSFSSSNSTDFEFDTKIKIKKINL